MKYCAQKRIEKRRDLGNISKYAAWMRSSMIFIPQTLDN